MVWANNDQQAVLAKIIFVFKLVKMVYEEIPEVIRTYNLKKVSAFNDYFADGVLVHNKGSQPSTPCANGDPCCVIVNGLPEYVC